LKAGVLDKQGSKVLLVGDEPGQMALLGRMLQTVGYLVETEVDPQAFEGVSTRLAESRAVILQYASAKGGSIQALQKIRRLSAGVPVILIWDAPSALDVVAAMKNGATDLLVNPVNSEQLRHALVF
jgi:DNA-binding NtrC family response regulator